MQGPRVESRCRALTIAHHRAPASIALKANRPTWWSPPVDSVSHPLTRYGMPPTLFGFVRPVAVWSQVRVSLLAIGSFVLNTAPLEMRLNAIVVDRDVRDRRHPRACVGRDRGYPNDWSSF